ncbi:VOC family protein, partial [Pseudomonas aeruginosa]
GPARAPTGACFNALLPHGTVVEFVHHRPQPREA